MEDKRGKGGRKAIEIDWFDIKFNDEECSVGSITRQDATLVHFLIDREDKERVNKRTWHYMVSGYIGSSYKTDDIRKTLYLHNLIMNRLEFDGKGAPLTVDHISGNGLDNRKKNLRLCSQSEQNRNTGKRPRKTDKLPNEIREEMPTNVWYASANGHHGDRFVVEIKGIPGIEDIIWKTTSSKSVTTREKLTSAITKRQELIDSMPALYNFIRDAELSQTLRDESAEIIELVSSSRIEHVGRKNKIEDIHRPINTDTEWINTALHFLQSPQRMLSGLLSDICMSIVCGATLYKKLHSVSKRSMTALKSLPLKPSAFATSV